MSNPFPGFEKSPGLTMERDLKSAKRTARRKGFLVRSRKVPGRRLQGPGGFGVFSGPLYQLYFKKR